VLHQLITSRGQKENGGVQRTTHPVSTSTLHMTEEKKDMKGDSKAKGGEAAAKSAPNVAKASYQCAGVLLTQRSLSPVHTTAEMFRCWVPRQARERGSDPWIDSWRRAPANSMLSFSGRILENCQFPETVSVRG
jgi:hypothetical protein